MELAELGSESGVSGIMVDEEGMCGWGSDKQFGVVNWAFTRHQGFKCTTAQCAETQMHAFL